MALAPLAELAQSYFDLRWHLDPVVAPRFGRFAGAALRPHLAAVRALTGALEELEPSTLDDEIDRTALLNDARVLLYRCEREAVFSRDPTQWVKRIVDGLAVLRGADVVAGRLKDVPEFLDDARAALVEPVGLFAETALELLPEAATAVQGAEAPVELKRHALDALAAFKVDLDRWWQAGPGRFAAGEDAFNFHLHYEHALRDTAPELWRYGNRLIEELKAGGVVLPELSVAPDLSLVRRMILSSLTLDGWALLRDENPDRLKRHAVGVLLDVGIHTRGLSVEGGVELLRSHLNMEHAPAEALVRRTAAAPTYALTAAVGRRELLALREDYQRSDFHAAVRPYGALPVSLIRWGLGLGE